MNKLREKGITLVALVVTVIILLILAGVTLGTILGNNGIINITKSSINKYKKAEEEEQKDIKKLENLLLDNNKTTETTETTKYTITYNLNREGDEKTVTQQKTYGIDIEILGTEETRENYEFLGWAGSLEKLDEGIIEYKKGDIYSKNEDITLYAIWSKVTVLAEDIGKDVNYNVEVDGIEGNYDWKLFYQGKENDGAANQRIFLISADYIPNTILDEKIENFVMAKVGSFIRYFSAIPTLQDMKNKDLFMNKYPLDNNKTKANTRCISVFLNTDIWENFKDQDGYADCVIGAPTIEMWSSAWNSMIPESGKDENGFVAIKFKILSGVGYQFYSSSVSSSHHMAVHGKDADLSNLELEALNQKKYKLFFPDTVENVTVGNISDICYGYWIASPSCRDVRATMRTNCKGSISYSGISNGGDTFSSKAYGIRPVVCLNSDVKLIWNEKEQIYLLKKVP